MTKDLTSGSPLKVILLFSLPLVLGNLFQQFYALADTIIVGRFCGVSALASVGATGSVNYLILGFVIGVCNGFAIPIAQLFGARDYKDLRRHVANAAWLCMAASVVLTISTVALTRPMMQLMQTPDDIIDGAVIYIGWIFAGIPFIFLYNMVAAIMRALGDSKTPLYFLILTSALNIGLDLLFMLVLHMGVEGAALATVVAQTVAALGLYLYTRRRFPALRLRKADCVVDFPSIRRLSSYSLLTCVQQSVMNFGILLVQGLVNSFGTAVMAAFAAAVKIDSFAYMPVQDFGNAFSTFIAQNFGAGRTDRIRRGIRSAVWLTTAFALLVSALVFVGAPWLMSLFVSPSEAEIVAIGVEYLRIEGSFYVGIGYLFLLYGFYRAVALPSMSVVLTVVSLGTRVLLAYLLASLPQVGYTGIWWSVPIGWALADVVGVWYYRSKPNFFR